MHFEKLKKKKGDHCWKLFLKPYAYAIWYLFSWLLFQYSVVGRRDSGTHFIPPLIQEQEKWRDILFSRVEGDFPVTWLLLTSQL